MVKTFEDDHPSPFAHDEAISLLIEGTTGGSWVLVIRAQGAGGIKAGNSERCNGAFAATGQHHFTIPTLDDTISITHRLGAGGTSSDAIAGRPLQAKGDGDLTGTHIADHHWYEEGAYSLRAFFPEQRCLRFHGLEPAYTGTDVDADAGFVDTIKIDFGVLKGQGRRGYGELGKPVHALGFLFVHVDSWVKVFDLSGNLRGKASRVKASDFSYSGLPSEQRCPKIAMPNANGRDCSETSYNYPSHHALPLSQFCADIV